MNGSPDLEKQTVMFKKYIYIHYIFVKYLCVRKHRVCSLSCLVCNICICAIYLGPLNKELKDLTVLCLHKFFDPVFWSLHWFIFAVFFYVQIDFDTAVSKTLDTKSIYSGFIHRTTKSLNTYFRGQHKQEKSLPASIH